MQKKIIATREKRTTIEYSVGLVLMTIGTILFSTLSWLAFKQFIIRGIACLVLALAGLIQCFRLIQNLRLRKGKLTVDNETLTWEFNGQCTIVSLSEVVQLKGWCGFYKLLNADGRVLVRFPECLGNINLVIDHIAKIITTPA